MLLLFMVVGIFGWLYWVLLPAYATDILHFIFLKENEEYKALRLDGRLLDIVLHPQISLKITDTAPPSRSDLNSSWKKAKLETGLQIIVPLFIAKGEIIRVDNAEKKYLGKDTSGG